MSGIVLITGANGFIGKQLLLGCVKNDFIVRACVRHNSMNCLPVEDIVVTGDISNEIDWSTALNGVDIVIHLAGRAHVIKETNHDPLTLFRKVNTDGTLHLARMAARAGVRRFIYISSIGVNGNRTTHSPFTEMDQPFPHDLYAISKYEAEQGLRSLSRETGLDIVVIRPPLVYGPGAPGNIGRLFNLVKTGIPLPFAAIYNQRSLIASDNLVDFIMTCMHQTGAENQLFLISDGEDISTTELLKKVASAMGKKQLLFPVPLRLMKFVAKALGKVDVVDRLFGSLQVDISKARDLLGWSPPLTMDESLRRTMDDV